MQQFPDPGNLSSLQKKRVVGIPNASSFTATKLAFSLKSIAFSQFNKSVTPVLNQKIIKQKMRGGNPIWDLIFSAKII